jgi:hypothetical protein
LRGRGGRPQLKRDPLGSNGRRLLSLSLDALEGPVAFTTTEQVLIAIELVLVMYSFRLYYLMTTVLKQRHPDKWQQLGSPSLFTGNSPAATSKMTGYVFGSRYRELKDEELSALAGRWRVVNILFIGGIVALVYQTLRYGP